MKIKNFRCAKVDNDNNEKNGSNIRTGTDTPIRNSLNKSRDFNWWIVIIVLGAIVLGTGIIVKFLINKRKSKSTSNDDSSYDII